MGNLFLIESSEDMFYDIKEASCRNISQ